MALEREPEPVLGGEELGIALRRRGFDLIRDRDWETALAVWRAVAALWLSDAEPLALQVLILRQLGRHDEALALAGAGILRHGTYARLRIEGALVPFVQRDWSNAAEAFSEIRLRFPEQPEGYVRGAFSALELGDWQQALNIIRQGAKTLPTDRSVLSGWAEICEHLGEWWDAALAWATLRGLGDGTPIACENELRCLSKAGCGNEAEATLARGLARHPDHPALLLEGARVATRRSAWHDAAKRWAGVAEGGAGLEAPSRIRDARRFADRDERSETILRPRSGQPEPAETRLFDHLTAASWTFRLNDRPPIATGVRLEPNGALKNYIGSWRSWELRAGIVCLLDDRDIPSAKLPDVFERDDGSLELRGRSFREREHEMTVTLTEESLPIGALMRRFESLGDNCEFGLVQRFYNVETMGLYRFNNAPLEQLMIALEERFDGLDDAARHFLKEDAATGEIIGYQETYRFGYHTGRYASEVDIAELGPSEHRRLMFLRDKLLEDLAGGEKIFVRKGESIEQYQLVASLVASLRRHGPNWLLWVVLEDQDNPSGTVVQIGDGWIRGHVEAFAPFNAVGRLVPDAWARVCAAAAKLIDRVDPGPQPVRNGSGKWNIANPPDHF